MTYYRKELWSIMLACLAGLILLGCTSGIENSPAPGIVRVILQSDPVDTSIVILNNTYVVTQSDTFKATVFQGRVYRDSLFSLLYRDLSSYRQTDDTYNLIGRENNQYLPIKLFESYVPAQRYNRLEFGLTGNEFKIGGSTGYKILVQLPPGEALLISMQIDFEVFENQVTEIVLQIKPLSSLVRYRDTYFFTREIELMGVKY